MSTVKEVLDAVEVISKSIDNIGKVIQAIKTGQGYLERRYKNAKNDICEILEEINKTLITTSSATSIVTHFSFIDDSSQYSSDLREFNNRIRDSKSEIVELKQNIDDYRGHCSKIRDHVKKIKAGNKLDHFFKVFGIKSKKENEKLSSILQDIYDEELSHYLTVYTLCDNLEKAIDHINETLGAPGLMKPKKVPEAADLLSQYGKAFLKIESKANHRVYQIRDLIRALS